MQIWTCDKNKYSNLYNDFLVTKDLSLITKNVIKDLRDYSFMELIDILNTLQNQQIYCLIDFKQLDVVLSFLEINNSIIFSVYYEGNDIIELFRIMNCSKNVVSIVCDKVTENNLKVLNIDRNKNYPSKFIIYNNEQNESILQLIDGIII